MVILDRVLEKANGIQMMPMLEKILMEANGIGMMAILDSTMQKANGIQIMPMQGIVLHRTNGMAHPIKDGMIGDQIALLLQNPTKAKVKKSGSDGID